MRIFILEDDPERIRWFREQFFSHNLTFADSVEQVNRFDGPYDLICLDHDLGGRQMTTHEDNGVEFARLIQHRLEGAMVLIHSYNPDGAQNIALMLGRGLIAPFRGPTFTQFLNQVKEP